jgi:hypothetical protein
MLDKGSIMEHPMVLHPHHLPNMPLLSAELPCSFERHDHSPLAYNLKTCAPSLVYPTFDWRVHDGHNFDIPIVSNVSVDDYQRVFA